MTVVKLRSVWRNVLEVEGLDAFDGSPVLDIKPFGQIDVGRVRLPKWWRLVQQTEPKIRPLG
jgi:tRNA (Thr-GGU) A37 N-methylase